jgi:hypothetical protein
MKRKFRGDRLFKIFSTIVNLVTAFMLIAGIVQAINYNKNVQFFLNSYSECRQGFGYQDLFGVTACQTYNDQLGSLYNNMYIAWGIAIGLPIIFYGGKKLTNYIFPKS